MNAALNVSTTHNEDAMKKITVTLPWKKETKGSHQYASDEEGLAVSTVYIRKSAIDGEAPKSIKVEISEGK